MRPYRKIDMGTEIERLDGRMRNLERLEAQLRVFQAIAGMLFLFVVGTTWKDCQAKQQESMEQTVIANDLKHHVMQPHGVCSEAVMGVQQLIKEHDDRLIAIEKRVKLRR